ncbi:single-stranded DNA-binding protein [Paucilactobacillus kaifaensis]|uniref:single-stranded DNA-binding protein n=1 Tax=Paucilactobacillus kaifaensis TaxID=2559921 RepID=UPI0010FA46B0|nr:single-stranded DNA-binding protein [Paucilactobacillus kaifaensis]
MINRAVLVGRLTNDMELRYTQSGTAVGSFNLAVNRQFKNADGDREADFVSCVVWRKAAESLANFTHKGSLIGIDGRIQTRNYENKQGTRVYVTEVVVENFSLLELKSENHPSTQTNTTKPKSSNGTSNPTDPFAGSNPMDIDASDLPF